MIMMLISIVFLGIALFSTLIHIKSSKFIWFAGLAILFAGLYFSYHAEGVYFYSELTVSNTTILGASMMFYMLFLCILISTLDNTYFIYPLEYGFNATKIQFATEYLYEKNKNIVKAY